GLSPSSTGSAMWSPTQNDSKPASSASRARRARVSGSALPPRWRPNSARLNRRVMNRVPFESRKRYVALDHRLTRDAKAWPFCYTDGTQRRDTMANTAPRFAWMNGKVIPWDQCVVHGRSAGGFMGSNVFEGVRAYWNAQQGELFVFKHEEHLQRLARSMKTVRMEVPFTLREIGRGALGVLRANKFRE